MTGTYDPPDSDLLYRSAVRATSEGIVLHAPDGSIRTANPSAETILGLTLDQMLGRCAVDPGWRLIREDGSDLPQDEIPSEITRRTGQPCRRRVLGVHRGNGELAWLSVSTDPVGPIGEPNLPVVAAFRDITRERTASAELEQSRAYLQRVFAAVPGVVFQLLTTVEGADRFLFVSPRVQEMFGVSPEQCIAEPDALFRRFHPEDLPLLEGPRDPESLTAKLRDCRVRGEQSGYRWVRVHALPERSDAGVTWTAVVLDIDEQRKLELALQRAQRREAMADLAAGLAHNFNNMLAVIVPAIDLTLRGSDPSFELLRDAQLAAENATGLVRELIALTRSEQTDRDGALNVATVVHEVVRVCRMTFDRSIALEERLPESPVIVRGRANHLHQMVLNLCLNARDALSGRESPKITLEIEPVTTREERSYVVLRVSDNGCGMDEATLARIGEPFFTTKGPMRGTGLGMASVFGTARDLGGVVECESTLGVGTVITVRLPALPQDALFKHSSPAGRSLAPRSQRLLIVDDEPLVRRALRSMLECMGRSVVEAKDGAEALACLEREGPFDGVLLDLSLPGTPGAKVLSDIRACEPQLPVIILSGYIGDVMTLEGASALLEKPISLERLGEVLDAL